MDFLGRGGGVHVESEDANLWGGEPVAILPRENLGNLNCLGQHFARFHGGQGEKENVE